jgi:hypothetical protein
VCGSRLLGRNQVRSFVLITYSLNLPMAKARGSEILSNLRHGVRIPYQGSGRSGPPYPQRVKIEGSRIYLPKVGWVKCVVHREIVGKVKTVTISRNACGQFHAAILNDNGEAMPAVSTTGKAIGIDVGLPHLAVTSDGSKFTNPRHLRRAEKNLNRKQRKLSRKTKGSNSRNKARRLVARAHEGIACARRDHLHKLSHRIVSENQVIAVEDLQVKGIMTNHNLAKVTADAGWAPAELPWSHAWIAARAAWVCSVQIVPPGGLVSDAAVAGKASDSAATISAQRAAWGAGSRAMLARAVRKAFWCWQVEQPLADRSVGRERVLENDRGLLEHALFGHDAGTAGIGVAKALCPFPPRVLPDQLLEDISRVLEAAQAQGLGAAFGQDVR